MIFVQVSVILEDARSETVVALRNERVSTYECIINTFRDPPVDQGKLSVSIIHDIRR